jgi:hypothetical protein
MDEQPSMRFGNQTIFYSYEHRFSRRKDSNITESTSIPGAEFLPLQAELLLSDG